MEIVVDLLMIAIPTVVVFITAYLLIKKFLDSEHEKRSVELQKAHHAVVTPVKLQAYERVILYLERISPNSLVMRVHKTGMSAKLLQAELLKSIRTEYEHNMSQQIYVSHNAWEMLRNAKEEMSKFVNIAANQVKDDANGIVLCEVMFEMASKIEKMPTQIAIEYIKKEFRQLMH